MKIDVDNDLELIVREHGGDFMLKVAGILVAIFVGMGVMLLFNSIGWQALNLIPFFLGFIWLIVVGSSPVAIGLSAFTGSLVRLSNLKNPNSGAADGIRFWLTVILPGAILSFCFLAGFLATWPFQKNPIAFWYVAAFIIVATTASIYFKKFSDLPYKIVMVYSAIVIIISLGSTIVNFDLTALSGELPQMDGQLFSWMPTWVASWWPIILIVLLAFVPHPKAANSFINLGIALLAIIWLAMTFPKMFGDNFTLFGNSNPSPCAIQNDKPVQEGEKLQVTICSQALETQNIASIQRIGPRPVKVEFAQSTLDKYGDILAPFTAEDFVTVVYSNTHMASKFHFQLAPNNEMFYRVGLHLEPINITVEYETSGVTNE